MELIEASLQFKKSSGNAEKNYKLYYATWCAEVQEVIRVLDADAKKPKLCERQKS